MRWRVTLTGWRIGPVLAVLLPVGLAACATAPAPPPYMCLLPGEKRMLVAELFFGRTIPGRGRLGEAEWRAFAADTITANFPDGFTVFDGEGQWRNPATGAIIGQPTKVVLVAVPRGPDLAPRLAAVIEAYKARFGQQSVGVVTRDSCAAF